MSSYITVLQLSNPTITSNLLSLLETLTLIVSFSGSATQAQLIPLSIPGQGGQQANGIEFQGHQAQDLQSSIFGLQLARQVYTDYALLGATISCRLSQNQQVAFRKQSVFYPSLVITHLRKLFSVATSLNISSSSNLTPRPLAQFHPVRGEVI